MEMFRRFKDWFSSKKELPQETTSNKEIISKHENESQFNKRRKFSTKRTAEPIAEDECVYRKICKKDPSAYLSDPVKLEKNNEYIPVVSLTKDDKGKEENLSEYEVETIKKIHGIRENCEEFNKKIDTFADITGSREFLYVDEHLVRNIEKLDIIDTNGSERIRERRRSVIKYIYLLIDKLEDTAKKNEEKVKPTEIRLPPLSRQQFLEGKTEE